MNSARKIKIIEFSLLTILIVLLVFTAASTAFSVINAVKDIREDSFFTTLVDGHRYKCFHIYDGEVKTDNVAIALNEDASSTEATTINVPSNVDDESNHPYTVTAIATAGFRYTNFTQINVPQTVDEIREEAFAYCQNLTSFIIPHLITEIAPSTFLDCRALEAVYYSNEDGAKTYSNDLITRIGDHAFDSCISLRDFNSPTNTVYYGESSFQNCDSIMNFYFPSAIEVDGVIQNKIVVRPYAFADCANFIFMYFETNMSEIDDHAFVDCNSALAIKYTGNSEPNFYRDGVKQNRWRHRYIALNKSDKIPLETKHPEMEVDQNYPCFRYTLSNEVVLLDSGRYVNNVPQTRVKVINEEEAALGYYAVIYKFDTPADSIPNCFDISTGELTIPDTLGGKTVKIIRESTFANNTAIKRIHFNENLVQIRNKAFYNCPNIEEIDFAACKKLVEVSYYVFQDYNLTNSNVTEIILPDCLQYVGGYAFANFLNVNSFALPSKLKAIADVAFYKLGANITPDAANVDLILPKTLEDDEADEAQFVHHKKGSFEHKDYTRWYAIGKYAFEGANCIKTATMADDPDHASDPSYTCSMFSNAFKDCASMVKFVANKNLQVVGKDCFKGCTSLRELFLTTTKSNASTLEFPWAVNEEDASYGGTLFTGSSKELVIYLDGPSAPGSLDSYHLSGDTVGDQPKGHKWNAETEDSYLDEIRTIDRKNIMGSYSRTRITTFYNVDYANGIKYWDPIAKDFVNTRPSTLEAFENGVISFVKQGNEYSVARYYFDAFANKGTDLVDLTIIPGVSSSLTKIGEEAFAKDNDISGDNTNKNRSPGMYYILPHTITEIGERAFYRNVNDGDKDKQKNNARYGVRMVTYKNAAGNYLSEDGTTEIDYDGVLSKIVEIEKGLDVDRRGWCVLPDGLVKIGNNAFYNNIFDKIRLGSHLTYIGHAAFFNYPCNSSTTKITNTVLTIGNNPYFEMSNDGLYYKYGGNTKRMLIYQIAGKTGTLTLDTETRAVGFQACANTSYTTVALNSKLETIYGTAFASNHSLTTVTGTSSLKYISAMENALGTGWSDPEYEEIFDETIAEHTSMIEFKGYAYPKRELIESLIGSFLNCSKLTTFDFKAMTNIRKIGPSAFQNDTVLENMCGSATYTYKQYNAGTGKTTVIAENLNKGVLDLSGATHLRSIGKNAFNSCNKLKYIHLPNNRGTGSESTLYVGYDPEAPYFGNGSGSIISNDKGVKVLVGETAAYANHDFGRDHNAQNHYGAACFGTSGNSVYYYIASRADIPTNDSTSLKYWTKSGNDFILINNAKDARVYFPA